MPMGKRQYRVFRRDITARTQELLQQRSVQVVQRNKAVLQGQLLKLGSIQLELLDGRNHTHMVPLHEIEEIIYDKETAY